MLHTLFKSAKAASKTRKSHKDDDKSSTRSGGNQSGRRLVRSHNIQVGRTDDVLSNDASRSSLFSTEHSLETGSVSTWGSQPLSPSIDFSNNANIQGNLSVSPSRSWDGDLRDSDEMLGYSTDSASSDGSFKSNASQEIFSGVTRHSEGDLQMPATHVGSPGGVAALQRPGHGYGGGLHIRTCGGSDLKSAPNSPLISPVSSPRLWNSTSNTLQQGSSLTPLASNYEKSTWTDAHPLPLPPIPSTTIASPPTSLASSIGTPRSSSKLESGLPAGKWQKGCLLGSGAFGKVYKGIHGETGELCAIKEVEFVEDDPKSKESAKQLEQEIKLLSSFRHPNIVHYKGSEVVDGRLNIYLEFVSGGSIYKLCQEFKKLEEPIIRRYTRQILQGLHFLHSLKTVHRDIKGANILVDQEGTVKLADFGMAKQIKQSGIDLLSFKGSPYWMAPEVIMQKNSGYEYAVDIWSLGCTVLEMATGKAPWSEYEGVAAMFKVSRAEIPPLPQSLSLEGHSFIKLCLQRNPADRPTAAALLQHPFVQISNDGPDQAMHMPDFSASNVRESSTTQENSGVSVGLARGGSQPLNRRQFSRAKFRVDIHPSRSAPVSPRSSPKDVNNEMFSAEFFPLPRFSTLPAGSPIRTGFSTPPPGSPRRSPPRQSRRSTGVSTPPPGSPRGMGFSRSPARSPIGAEFDFYAKPSNTAGKRALRQAHASNGLPRSSNHDMVNSSDSHWDEVYENRQIPHRDKPRTHWVYRTEDVQSHREEGQDYTEKKTYRTLQQMDEKANQVFLERSPHQSPRHNGKGYFG